MNTPKKYIPINRVIVDGHSVEINEEYVNNLEAKLAIAVEALEKIKEIK